MDTSKRVWNEASAHEAWLAALKRMGDQARQRGMPVSTNSRWIVITRSSSSLAISMDWRPEGLIRTFVEIVEHKAMFERTRNES
jgi:hypothetical protein